MKRFSVGRKREEHAVLVGYIMLEGCQEGTTKMSRLAHSMTKFPPARAKITLHPPSFDRDFSHRPAAPAGTRAREGTRTAAGRHQSRQRCRFEALITRVCTFGYAAVDGRFVPGLNVNWQGEDEAAMTLTAGDPSILDPEGPGLRLLLTA